MTELEAAEEILRGPYSTCICCKGAGQITHKSPSMQLIHDVNVFNVISCKKCRGSGKWLRGDYRMACVVLGMECPEVPKGLGSYKDWSNDTRQKFVGEFPISKIDRFPIESSDHTLDWASSRILPDSIVQIPEWYAESDYLKKP